MSDRYSLASRHRLQAPWVMLLLLLAAGALTAGLLLPALTITRIALFDSQLSILGGLADLWTSGHLGVFMLILLFSVMLPYTKLALLTFLFLARASAERRRRLLALLSGLGKWSMLDVLVVAVMVA